MATNTEYYYADAKGQRKGPYTLTELQQLRLPADARVWHEGLPSWTTAHLLPELEGHLRALPPPLPASARPWHRRRWVWVAAAVVLIAGSTLLYIYSRPTADEEIQIDWSKATPAEKERRKAEELAHPERFLKITHQMHRNLIHQAVVTYSVHSRAAFVTYIDPTVSFEFYGQSDTHLSTRERTLYLKIPPGGTMGGKLKFFVDRQATWAKLVLLNAHANDQPTGADTTTTDSLARLPDTAPPLPPPAPASP